MQGQYPPAENPQPFAAQAAQYAPGDAATNASADAIAAAGHAAGKPCHREAGAPQIGGSQGGFPPNGMNAADGPAGRARQIRPPGSPPLDGAGIVQRAATASPNGPRHVLLAPNGRILAYLQADRGVNLDAFVGRSMGIIGARRLQPDLQTDLIIVRGMVPVRLAQPVGGPWITPTSERRSRRKSNETAARKSRDTVTASAAPECARPRGLRLGLRDGVVADLFLRRLSKPGRETRSRRSRT